MAWKKGELRGAKTGGRRAGTPNKSTLQFQQTLEKHGLNPGEAMINIYREQMKIYAIYKKENDLVGMSSTMCAVGRTLSNICEYVYPKKKAIEHISEQPKTFADFMMLSLRRDNKAVEPT